MLLGQLMYIACVPLCNVALEEVKKMEKKIITGKRFEGKVAIVTASTKGIGLSIAHRLGLEGASVIVCSRSEKNVEEAVQTLKAEGIQVSGVVCHVSNAQHRTNLIQHAVQMYGKIDVIVSTAGVNPTPGLVLDTPESALDKLWDANVKASILLLREAMPHLTKGSSVILVSTVAAYQYVPMIAMYGASKTALLGLTKALAAEMSPNVRVNCIAPGYVPTEFSSIVAGRYREVKDALLEATCLKRAGTTEEIAAAAVFLASDDASYITGETLVVAGGAQARL